MCRDISRDNCMLVWQYIDFKTVIRYIENLKSRIYKAFYSKTQRSYGQFTWLTSPLVMLLTLKNVFLITDLRLSSFEIGYLIFCLRDTTDLDIDFFSYYRQTLDTRLNCKIQNCVARVKYSMVMSLIELYEKYLLSMISAPGCQFYNLNTIFSFDSAFVAHQFALRIDVKYFLSSLSLPAFLAKFDLAKSIKIYLLSLLSQAAVADIMSFYVDTFLNHLAVQKKQANFACRLLSLFLLQLSYEVLVMIDGFFYLSKPLVKTLVFFYDFSGLIILSSDPSLLKVYQKKWFSFLSFNGIKIQCVKDVLPLGLYQGMDFNQLFVSINTQFYPFYFAVKPSLYAQFILMQRISALLLKSKAQPLFIVIIRLNMLILFWSNIYVTQPAKKIFCLIDYLVALKLNLFLKRKRVALLSSKIKLLDFRCGTSNPYFRIFKAFPVTIVSNTGCCKYYALARLSYL